MLRGKTWRATIANVTLDLLHESNVYRLMYTVEEKEAFVRHMSELNRYKDNYDLQVLREIFLGIYANPIDSKSLFNHDT